MFSYTIYIILHNKSLMVITGLIFLNSIKTSEHMSSVDQDLTRWHAQLLGAHGYVTVRYLEMIFVQYKSH